MHACSLKAALSHFPGKINCPSTHVIVQCVLNEKCQNLKRENNCKHARYYEQIIM